MAHLLKNINGHLQRVDGRVYLENHLVGVLPTHLLKGYSTVNLSSYRWVSQENIYTSYDDPTSSLPTSLEISNALAGSGNLTNFIFQSSSSYLTRSAGSWAQFSAGSYLWQFTLQKSYHFFRWPTGHTQISGVRISVDISGSGNLKVSFAAMAASVYRSGGTDLQPRYSCAVPNNRAGLLALPHVTVSGPVSNHIVPIIGNMTRNDYIVVVSFPEHHTVEAVEPPTSGTRSVSSSYTIRQSTSSSITAWAIV